MRYLQLVPVILAGLLLSAHGLAHAPGALGSLELATFDDVSYQPNAVFTSASDAMVRVLGMVWVVAGVAFVVAGLGVVLRKDWARPAALFAVAVSLPVTVLWYQDAIAGLVLNLVILGALLVSLTRDTLSGKRMTLARR